MTKILKLFRNRQKKMNKTKNNEFWNSINYETQP